MLSSQNGRALDVTNAKPFSAVFPPDPTQLRRLRHDVSSWLRQIGSDQEIQDAVVVATHEVVASAMGSPGDVFVDATSDGETVTVVVTSADGWTSPDDDLGGSRMSIVREMVENVAFEKRSGKPHLSFQKPL
jgi:hypothetical protein